MVRMEAVFGCGGAMTPDIAVRLVQLSEHCSAVLHLECGGARVRLDSLIGILAVDCRQGTPLTVIAEGADERAAAEAAAKLLRGE